MTFNYRVVKKQYPRKENGDFDNESPEDHREYFYGIHEVYYDHNGLPIMVSMDGETVFGETVEDLMICWAMFSEAFNKPILDFDKDIPHPDSHNEINERLQELKDENGKLKPISELIEEKKITHYDDLLYHSVNDFDMKEFINEHIVSQAKSEKWFGNTCVGQPLSRVIEISIQKFMEEEQSLNNNEEEIE